MARRTQIRGRLCSRGVGDVNHEIHEIHEKLQGRFQWAVVGKRGWTTDGTDDADGRWLCSRVVGWIHHEIHGIPEKLQRMSGSFQFSVVAGGNSEVDRVYNAAGVIKGIDTIQQWAPFVFNTVFRIPCPLPEGAQEWRDCDRAFLKLVIVRCCSSSVMS